MDNKLPEWRRILFIFFCSVAISTLAIVDIRLLIVGVAILGAVYCAMGK